LKMAAADDDDDDDDDDPNIALVSGMLASRSAAGCPIRKQDAQWCAQCKAWVIKDQDHEQRFCHTISTVSSIPQVATTIIPQGIATAKTQIKRGIRFSCDTALNFSAGSP